MEILKLKPAMKDYLWGGRRLVEEYNKVSDLEKVAETWEMSNHKDGSSVILNGEFSGVSFKDYLEQQGKKAWGKKCEKYDSFPIMIKFIDAAQALSIQVHPDDEYALKNEGEFGKNEFWYVLEAKPDAFLYYGVNQEMTKEEYRKHIEDDTICDYLKKVKVNKGDCFFIKTGTIHAIGAGIIVAEIQQCSNSTYRVYDFKRLGVDGKPRELHVDKAVEVSNLTPSEKNGKPDGNLKKYVGYNKILLSKNDYFICEKYDVDGDYQGVVDTNSFQALTILDGSGVVSFEDGKLSIQKGDSIFIPAQEGKYKVTGNLSFIKTRV
ncbi:MAG: type I phosphomannose isomerase catalytic subunit [Coprobacillus sp.]